jgi:hypothetical protein
MVLTRRVGELVLLLLYAVLESFGISAGNRDLLLDGFCASVGHGCRMLCAIELRGVCGGRMRQANDAVERRDEGVMSRRRPKRSSKATQGLATIRGGLRLTRTESSRRFRQ